MKDTNSLSHTSYRCKYHIVIVPKYRRMVIYNKLRRDIVQILTLLINRKPDVKLIEGEACPDHIHMLLEIPPKYAVADFMGYLKSKSTLMIFDRHANLKYKYGSRHFWAKGYFVDTVGKNEKVIKEYIQNQLQEDKLYDQMSLKEFIDPFTGEPVKALRLSGFSERNMAQQNALIGREHTTSFRRGYDYRANQSVLFTSTSI